VENLLSCVHRLECAKKVDRAGFPDDFSKLQEIPANNKKIIRFLCKFRRRSGNPEI
jgi:hypothetical protein